MEVLALSTTVCSVGDRISVPELPLSLATIDRSVQEGKETLLQPFGDAAV